MGLINTGMQRATELVVSKKAGDVSVGGYPRVYNLRDAFGNFIAMSNDELARMPVDSFKARVAGFKTYVESVEIGVSINAGDAYRENLGTCPI